MSDVDDKAKSFGLELQLDKVEKGLVAGLPGGVPQVLVRGVPSTAAEILKAIRELNDPWKEVRGAHALIRRFTTRKVRLTKDARAYLNDLCAAFRSAVGSDSLELANYGFRPTKKARPLTVEENVRRTAKARLTRKKRGTLGKKQRRAITGGTPGAVLIDPDGSMRVAEGAHESPPSTPAEGTVLSAISLVNSSNREENP